MKYTQKLSVLTLLFTVLIISYSVIRFQVDLKRFHVLDIDLFIFAESLKTTIHGTGFFFNGWEWRVFGAWSHFGVHNSPFLIMLLPVYAVFPSYYTLIILQDLVVPVSTVILFKFARKLLHDERQAFAVSVAFLVNPLLHGTVRYAFHPAVFGIPLCFCSHTTWQTVT